MSSRKKASDFDAESFLVKAHRGELPEVGDLQDQIDALKAELRDWMNLGKRKPRVIPEPIRKPPLGSGKFRRMIIIPDTQCKAGVPLDHLTWAGKYIAEKKPDIVIHLGDNWDFPSLSSYDKGKHCFEGRRYKMDIEAGNHGMRLLTEPYRKIKGYKPEEHFLFGNHEDRVTRLLENEPWLDGVVGFDDLDLSGWNTHKFLEVVDIEGVLFSHYFYNPKNSRPWGGMAATVLKNVGRSFVQGHRQGLDISLHQLSTGGRRRGIIAGSFYQHDEEYLGPQGDHWRGILVLNEVRDGDFDVLEVSLDFLRRKYA